MIDRVYIEYWLRNSNRNIPGFDMDALIQVLVDKEVDGAVCSIQCGVQQAVKMKLESCHNPVSLYFKDGRIPIWQ